MHLAIISPFPPAITGIGQYGYHVSLSLANAGAFQRISILAGASNGARRDTPSPLLDVNYPWQLDQISAGLKISSALRKLKPDLAWFNLGVSAFGKSPLANFSGFLAVGQARKLGIPTVVTLHELIELSDLRALNAPGGIFAKLGARWITRTAMQADVICLTLRHYAEWLSVKYPERKFVHIPIGAYHSPNVLPESTEQELLFFSTLAPFKGIETLIEAFRFLLTSRPNLKLTIAGAVHRRFPDYASSLEKKFSGVPNIQWLQQVPEVNVQRLFERAQVIILPYTASTGSSSVLYQAAMWGRPIIASDLPEMYSAANESLLQVEFFKANSAESLAASIEIMLNDSSLRRAQVKHNFEVIKKIRPEETLGLYVNAFNLALAKSGSSKRIDGLGKK